MNACKHSKPLLWQKRGWLNSHGCRKAILFYTNCKKDIEEADKLYALYFKLAQIATHKDSDPAWRALGRCYEMGWGTPINLKETLRCYRDTVGGRREEEERVIQKIQGTWQEDIEDCKAIRQKTLFQRFLEIFKK